MPKPSSPVTVAETTNSLTVVIPDGYTSKEPVRLDCSGGRTKTIVVSVGARADVVLFEVHGAARMPSRTELTLGAEAKVSYVLLSPRGAGKAGRTLRSTVGEGAALSWHIATVGGAGDESTLVSTLIGRNAVSSIDWIFSLEGKEKQSVSVRNVFGAPSGGGEITLKGVAEGSAHAECDGMIEITEQGRGTDTYLTEDVLMLDPTAKIDAIPGLEIRTNDVKASHSATVSRVTAEDLFYFRSRGIAPEEARRMYVEGFLGDLTERIPDAGIRTEVLAALQRGGR